MSFEFRAHRPSAYFLFVIFLVLLVIINLVLISIIFPEIRSVNEAAMKTFVLIVPWLLLLLLPSVILGILIYRSFVKSYSFTVEETGLEVKRLKKDRSVKWQKKFLWEQVKAIQIVDFEDNHYCNLRFDEKKNDLVIHRESGEFDKFYEAMRAAFPHFNQNNIEN